MKALIPDTNAADRLDALEQFIERLLGQRLPEFGATEAELQSVQLPDPLRRFFRFAGRWPGHNPETPFANRFCMQDTLCAIKENGYAPTFEILDSRVVFVWENQGVWVAATEESGADPPVWISEDCSHRESCRKWKRLDKPLSHFLVSFALQELMFGSETLGVATNTLSTFQDAGVATTPVWLEGEYVWDDARPSYFLASDCILIRVAPDQADGDDWYGCSTAEGKAVLLSLSLPVEI